MKFFADSHCDLLAYSLLGDKADFRNPEVHCSVPQLLAGRIGLQVLAIYTSGATGSESKAYTQSLHFKELIKTESDVFAAGSVADLEAVGPGKTAVVAALENASGICDEISRRTSVLENFRRLQKNTGRMLYVSLTHHKENRFGGGNHTDVGLKPDGKYLLDFLSGRKIAIDLSHASDALAGDILDYTEKMDLDLPVIASHSNFRALYRHPRNLSDDFAREIIRRQGLIGINWLRDYLGDSHEQIFRQFEYAEKIGARDAICSGADLFFDKPLQPERYVYFDEFQNADDTPALFEKLAETLPADFLENAAHKNLLGFMRKLWGKKVV